jgi:colanic acid biosynthesis glycosyl transferase WcaI
MGLLKGKFLKNLVLGAERRLLSLFDVVSSISGSMLSKLRSKGVVEEHIRFFPNWVDIAHICPLSEPSHYRKELGIEPNVKVVLFSGSLGNKQGLMVIPDAARKLAHREDIVFVVCGDGVTKPQLENACSGLTNVRFIPLQPFEKLGQLLGLADIHLLPQSPEAADLVLPSKLSGMLASGMPVIATCRQDTEIASVVSKCGIVVPPENGGELAYAIERLVDNDEERLKLGAQARIYSEENLARDSILGRLLEQFTVVTTAPKKPGPVEPVSTVVMESSELSDARTRATVSIPANFMHLAKISTVPPHLEMLEPIEDVVAIAPAIQLLDEGDYQMQTQLGVRRAYS